jgi:hypothetical protein
MGRLFRVTGEGARPATNDEIDHVEREKRDRAAVEEAQRGTRERRVLDFSPSGARSAPVPVEEPEPRPPASLTARLADGSTYTVHAADVLRRRPELEAMAENITGAVVRVWWCVHIAEGATRLRGMVGRGDDGQAHVFLNAIALPCPLLRLSTLRHEVEHVMRGDLDSPFAHDGFAESRCNDAAEQTMEAAVAIYARRCSPAVPPLNVGACIECERTDGKCRQDPATFADLKARVPY